MKKVFVETARLLLRQWTEDDIEPFCRLTGDPVVMEFFPSVMTREETVAAIRRYRDRIDLQGLGFWAAERKDTGAFIGFTGLSVPGFTSYFTPCVEIGWRLNQENWNNGFATEAATSALEYGFDTLRLDKICAFTAMPNIRSQRVMQKIGMKPAGFFAHPFLADGHWLKSHVLYETTAEQFHQGKE